MKKLNWKQTAWHLIEHLEPGKYISVYCLLPSVEEAFSSKVPLIPAPVSYGRYDFIMLPQGANLTILCNYAYGEDPFVFVFTAGDHLHYSTIAPLFCSTPFEQALLTYFAEHAATDQLVVFGEAKSLLPDHVHSQWDEVHRDGSSVSSEQLAAYLVEGAEFGTVTNFIRKIHGQETEISTLKVQIGHDRKLIFFPDHGEKRPFIYSLFVADEDTPNHLANQLDEYFNSYDELIVAPEVAETIARKEALDAVSAMDCEEFASYIHQTFNVEPAAKHMVVNIVEYAASHYSNPEDQRSFIRTMFEGTGINLTDEELGRIEF